MKSLKLLAGLIAFIVLFCMNDAAGQWLSNGDHIYNTNTGNVGVSTSTPSSLLHVAKFMGEPTITIQNLGAGGGATYSMIDNLSGANWKFKATTIGGFKIRDQAHLLDVFQIEPGSVANALYIKSGGNVGIQTINPQANLHVENTGSQCTAAFGTRLNVWSAGGTYVQIADDNDYSILHIGQLSDRRGQLIWNYNADPNQAYFSIGCYSPVNNLILRPEGGKIGIHTITPQASLDVYTSATNNAQLGQDFDANYFYYNQNESNGDGQSTIYGYRDGFNDGTAYSMAASNVAIRGYSFWGNTYSFGTAGFNYNDYTRCGGVIGAKYSGEYWGSLGYKTSGYSTYGGYFSNAPGSGSGKSGQPAHTGIGIAAWGDLFGADIHGKIYGSYIEGENYALFTNGDVYKNKLDIHLQKNSEGTNTPLYTNVSSDVTVMTSGIATLSQGKALIIFDKAFTESVSPDEPLVVTITPAGSTNGVYYSDVTTSGFNVTENNNGKSAVTVSYIAIGKRAGYEHPQLSGEVISADYTAKLARGLHNDADLQKNGEGLYYENGKLVVGIHPSMLPDSNKPAITVLPEKQINQETRFDQDRICTTVK